MTSHQMTKSEVQKFLNKLKGVFSSDQDSLSAIEVLWSKSQLLDDQIRTTLEPNADFPIPKELQDLTDGHGIFTDGACRNNPGPGAWAMMIQNARGDIIMKSSGVEHNTTNNRMELQGIIQGLMELKALEVDVTKPVFVYSDSKYAVDGATQWMPGWKSRGWKKSDQKTPENVDLWKHLDEVQACFSALHFIWVKGHNGHPQNEHCDHMCNDALNQSGF